METSDSECFESADEEFYSDEETTLNVKNNKKCDDTITEKLEDNVIDFDKKLNVNDATIKEDVNDNSKLTENVTGNLDLLEQSRSTKEVKDVNYMNGTVDDLPKVKEKAESVHTTKDTKVCRGKEKLGMKLGSKISSGEKLKNTEVASQVVKRETETVSENTKPNEIMAADKVTEKSTVEEDNLWDDEEIDWGKEEMLNKQSEHTTVVEKHEENMWENDVWEPINQSITQKTVDQTRSSASDKKTDQDTWGGWSGWGVSSIISTATQVSQKISSALETGIGVPNPEELARLTKEETDQLDKAIEQQQPDCRPETNSLNFGLGNIGTFVSGVTKLVESTGTKVISGGLDTLETIGKKTMEVLQEGDPGLKKKRAFLKLDQEKTVLSQVLREAKEKAEEENRELEQKHVRKRMKNYETLFDDHQGLVHLEALEMLSKQCDIKLQTLSESLVAEPLIEMQETMDQVKELCELPDEDEDEQITVLEIREKLESAVAEINIPITYERLISTWDETESWLNNLKLNVCSENELHQQAIETLAQLTAIAVEQFHKAGELLLVKEHRSTADEADSLVQLTTTLTSLIGIVAAKFSDKLNAKATDSPNKDDVNGLITNVFFEAANSSSYVQDAFQLLIPVLQVGAV